MITEYKVIKPFGCAEVDDVFSYNKENENFIMSSEKTTDNTYSAKSMVISAKVIANYTINKVNHFYPNSAQHTLGN